MKATISKVSTVQPQKLLGLIFGGIGLLFLVLGVIFVLVSADKLPMLADVDVWVGETPDELDLPVVGIVFAGIGLIFTVLGVGFLLALLRRKRLKEELLTYGTRVTGTVADIRIDRAYQVNGRHPLRIMVQAQDPFTGETRTLRGPLVWETSLSTGDPAEVLFDPMDSKKYFVDL